jgi:hypothetical protein
MQHRRFLVLRNTLKRSGVLLVSAMVLVVVFVLNANANGAQVLVSNGKSADVNLIKFTRVEYVGQCPGVVISPGARQAKFSSSSTAPAPRRRVIIRNLTQGIDNDLYPYTDRAYDRGEYSQGFDFALDDRHRTRTFSVLEGNNKFEYEIKEDNKVIEKGAFAAQVSVKDVGVFPRDAICQEERICNDVAEYGYNCDDKDKVLAQRRKRQVCYPTTKCTCPS